MLYTKFPAEHRLTQQLARHHGFGAVVAAHPAKVFGRIGEESYGKEPNFSKIDEQLNLTKRLNVHLHPVISRSHMGLKKDKHLLLDRVQELGMPVVDRYADRVKRFTLCQELTHCDPELWDEIVAFYKAVRKKYPGHQLWIGDFWIRDRMDRDGLLTRLEDLQGIATGFVGADYIELSRTHYKGVLKYAKVMGTTIPFTGRFGYLPKFWKQLHAMGFKVALETAAFADEDTPLIRTAQANTYQRLFDLCKKHSVEFWPWCLADDASRDFVDSDRRPHAGFYGADGQLRLNTTALKNANTLAHS